MLKLPRRVTFTNSTTLTIQYESGATPGTGQKLRMTTTPASGTATTRDYVGAFQYLNNNLFEIGHPEGRYSPTGGYEFFHKDHLGNVRAVTSQTTTAAGALTAVLTQYTDYDPWGLPLWGTLSGGNSTNRSTFLGREYQSELGYQDLQNRLYDPTIGRFTTIDPLPDVRRQESWSPFHYSFNNPIRFSDPTGLVGDPPGGLTGFFKRLNDWFSSFLNGGPFSNSNDQEAVSQQSNIYARDQATFQQFQGAVERADQAQNMVFSMIPGASALKSTAKGNYQEAAISGSLDLFGGALLRNAGGLIAKFTKSGRATELVDDVLRWEVKASEKEAEGIGFYMKKIQEDGIESVNPIHVVDFGGKTLLVDGHHRLAAAKQLGIAEVPVLYLTPQQFKLAADRMGRFSTPEALYSITQRVKNQVDVQGVIK